MGVPYLDTADDPWYRFLMSIQPLLDQIPFAAKAGVQCESYTPGRVVLSIGLQDSNKNHMGTMHAAALFTVAETAGAAAWPAARPHRRRRTPSRAARPRAQRKAGAA